VGDRSILPRFQLARVLVALVSRRAIPPRRDSIPDLRHVPEKIYVTYNYSPAQRGRVQQMFLEAGLLDVVVDPALLTGHHKLPIPNEETVAKLGMAARVHALSAPTVQRVLEPTARELGAARLLHMFVWIHHSHEGHPRQGVTYDESSACASCGDGLKQLSPLVLANKEIPRSGMLGSVDDEVLVHDSLAAEMEAASLTGIRFAEVLDHQGCILPWKQLVIESAMPPMIAAARGLVRGRSAGEAPCPRCGCDGWFDSVTEPFLPAYVGESLLHIPDFARTAERFGTGNWSAPVHGKRSLASRRLIVRPVVYAFFRARKIRGVRFTPVTVI
jgi:hypothetical protein